MIDQSSELILLSTAREELEMPRLMWSQDPESGDITVTTEVSPVLVELWSAPSCSDARRDWRTVNLDSPCQCGTAQDGICFNEVSDWSAQTLEETAPGMRHFCRRISFFTTKLHMNLKKFFLFLSLSFSHYII